MNEERTGKFNLFSIARFSGLPILDYPFGVLER